MKPYILMNTRMRAKATNEFEKEFYKLANNAVFGKTMENLRKHADIRLVTSDEQALRYANKPNFARFTIIEENTTSKSARGLRDLSKRGLYIMRIIGDVFSTTRNR